MPSIRHRHKKRTAAVLAGLLGCGIALGTTLVRPSEAAPPMPVPSVTITSGPTGMVNVRTASFAFTSNVNAGFFCSLDGSPFASCSPNANKTTGSVSYSGLADGPHNFIVVARVGALSSTPAIRSWTIDATRPTVVSITRLDPNPHALGVVRWLVTFSEPVINVALSSFSLNSTGLGGTPALVSISPVPGPASTYTVSADSGTGTPSANPSMRLDLANLGSIRDLNNNPLNGGLTGETYNFDTSAPQVTLTKVNGSVVSFPYLTNANVTSVGGGCSATLGDVAIVNVTINSMPALPVPCTSGSWSLTLAPAISTGGAYTFTATQNDTVGNTGTSGSKTVTIDKTAPIVTVTKVNNIVVPFPYSTPATVTSLGGSCTTSDGPVKVTITVRPDAFVACTSGTWSLGVSLATGTYTVAASQTDAAGNTGTSGAKTVASGISDPVAPLVTLTSMNGSTSIEGSPITFPLTTSDSVGSVGGSCGVLPGDMPNITVTITGPAPSTSPVRSGTGTCVAGAWAFSFPALPNGADLENLYTITATQLDSASNLGTTGAKQFTIATYKFTVTGTSLTPLTPGTTSQLDLKVKNPYSFPLRIDSITVTFSTTIPGCDGPTNFEVASPLTAPFVVASTGGGDGTAIPPGLAPVIRMKNLSTNQDACKVLTGPSGTNPTITLTFGGTASRP